MKKCFILSVLGILGLFLTSCNEEAGKEVESGKLNVVCTVGMIADVARVIGGEEVSVTNIIGEGVDPHVYKPTASDVKTLQAADVIFYNGLHLEGKMGDILAKISEKGKPVYAVAEDVIKEGQLIKDEEGESDPHLWMDVDLWSSVVVHVSKKMVENDGVNADLYNTNTRDLIKKMLELRTYSQTSLASIPAGQRELITAHDAFGYMERAYGLRVRGIQGISTESETGLKELEELINYIIEKKIPSVFVESSVNDKNVKALIEGAKARGHNLKIGGELFSDAMGAAGTYEGTYIGMIDHNVTVITNALGGTAPPKGMQEKLGE